MRLGHISLSSTEVTIDESGGSYIELPLRVADCTPFCFSCKDRRGWNYSFLGSSTNWLMYVQSTTGTAASGSFSGTIFYVLK